MNQEKIRSVAVIDLGKTNSKVALVDTANCAELEVIKQKASVRSDTIYPSLDHEEIEAFVIDALQTLSKTHDIDAITVTTHGATAALINAEGQLAMPVIDYEFTGVDELRDEYDNLRPPFADTGSPALPGGQNVGAQLYWQQKNYAKQFSQASTVLTWPQYWVHRLTEQRHNDLTSVACHTDLYEPMQKRYSKLVDQQNWRALMPPTRNPGQLSGTLTPTFAHQTGLPSNLSVYTGIHDSNASLVPHLITQTAPFSVVSTGTWIISMAIGGLKTTLDESRDTLININARGEPVPSARYMGGRERDLLKLSEPVIEQAMDKLLNNIDTTKMLMPSIVSNTGPYPNEKHKWIGSTEQNDTSAKACAATLYLALMTHECLLLIGAEGPTFIEGPLAHDNEYAQMLSAVSKRPVMISQSETGTSVGAAMLISPPQNPPGYTEVKLEKSKREKLERYATRWKQQLTTHTK